MNQRKKARVKALQTKEEATIAAMELADALAKQKAAEAERERQVQAVAEPLAIEADQYKATAEGILKRLKSWATRKRSAVFGEARSITLAGHELSFRATPGKVVIDDRTQDEVAQLIADDEELSDEFVMRFTKQAITLKKKEIIDAFNQGESEAVSLLRRFGIRVVKSDQFNFKEGGAA